jgi:excisionase family DNA binding protein
LAEQVEQLDPMTLAIDALDPVEIPRAAIPAVLLRLAALQTALAARLAAEPTPITAPAPTALLTPKAAADHLGVPETWLRDKARAGVVKFVKLGLYVRFRLEDLEVLARKGST